MIELNLLKFMVEILGIFLFVIKFDLLSFVHHIYSVLQRKFLSGFLMWVAQSPRMYNMGPSKCCALHVYSS